MKNKMKLARVIPSATPNTMTTIFSVLPSSSPEGGEPGPDEPELNSISVVSTSSSSSNSLETEEGRPVVIEV